MDDGLEIIIAFDDIIVYIANINVYLNISSSLYINIFVSWLFTLIVNFMFGLYPIMLDLKFTDVKHTL